MSAKATPRTKSDERRRSSRKAHVVEAWIASPTATDPSERVEVTSVNISRTGLCFSTKTPLPTDAFYRIEMGMGAQRIISEVEVVSCRKVTSERYDVGAQFC